MFIKRKSSNERRLAIEVCHSSFSASIRAEMEAGGFHIETVTKTWRKEATTLLSEKGQQEFSQALRALVVENSLQGAQLLLTLNGDFCVTRAVSGDMQHIRHELAELEHRSALYLTLGRGRKAIGGSIRKLGGQRHHALLSVVNQDTLNVLMEAAAYAHVILERIEPSLVSIARVVGAVEIDKEQPTLVVNVAEHGVQLGLSFQGCLLLDYRPAGGASPHEMAMLVSRHLNQIRRYCGRYVCLGEHELRQVVICGYESGIENIRDVFLDNGELEVVSLQERIAREPWHSRENDVKSDQVAALGACLLEDLHNTSEAGPNLMERLQALHREPLAPELVRRLWPLAAMIFVAVGMWFAAHRQNTTSTSLAAELASYDELQQRSRLLQMQTIHNTQAINQHKLLAAYAAPPRWREIATTLVQCLPSDVWLESLSVEGRNRMQISGEAYTEDGIFEFVRTIKKYPRLRKVSLTRTQPARTPTGPSTRFDVLCEITEK